MNETEKQINSLISNEDSGSFNKHKFSGKTIDLMLELNRILATEDIIYNANGSYVASDELVKIHNEYKESVRSDLEPIAELVQKTRFAN